MDNDLISRSALLTDIEEAVVISARDTISTEMRGIRKVVDRIEAAPTVDAVEVVRCRDCKFYNNHALRDVVFDSDACHWNADEQPDPDDYCSAGERKTE